LKNIFKTYLPLIIGAGLIMTLVVSCSSAGKRESPAEEKPVGLVAEAEVDFRPLGDARDRTVIEGEGLQQPAQTVPAKENEFNWAYADSFLQAQQDIDTSTIIYRIQLFASQYFTEAQYEQQIAQEVFDDSVFVKYDLPYYKVLLGNTTNKRQGRRLLYTARSLGYYNSWLVESPPDSIYFRMMYIEDSIAAADSLMNLGTDSLDLEPEDEGADF